MNIPVPDFIPIPSSEILSIISIVLLIVGFGLACVGFLLVFLRKRKGKKTTIPWVCVGVGILLMANHGIQLLYNL